MNILNDNIGEVITLSWRCLWEQSRINIRRYSPRHLVIRSGKNNLEFVCEGAFKSTAVFNGSCQGIENSNLIRSHPIFLESAERFQNTEHRRLSEITATIRW